MAQIIIFVFVAIACGCLSLTPTYASTIIYVHLRFIGPSTDHFNKFGAGYQIHVGNRRIELTGSDFRLFGNGFDSSQRRSLSFPITGGGRQCTSFQVPNRQTDGSVLRHSRTICASLRRDGNDLIVDYSYQWRAPSIIRWADGMSQSSVVTFSHRSQARVSFRTEGLDPTTQVPCEISANGSEDTHTVVETRGGVWGARVNREALSVARGPTSELEFGISACVQQAAVFPF